jgi:hypothetical protein
MTFSQLLPPFAIATAIAASLAMPVLLAVFARGPFARLALGRRFWFAMGTAVATWLLALATHAASAPTLASLMLDACAGAVILATAGLVVYSVWSLACFGFTTSMLLSLDDAGRALSLEAWADAFADGHGMRAFVQDRAAFVTGMGLAVEEDGRLRLHGEFAVRFADLIRSVARVFAMRMDA